MNSDLSTHKKEKFFSWVISELVTLKFKLSLLLMLKMSGFEGIKNYNAQDDKIFSLIIFSGVVNLLKQCSDKMHEP